MIEFDIDVENSFDINNFEFDSEGKDTLEITSDELITGETDDYEKLKNKPKLNGMTIIGNMNEIDPTVPGWAKNENKPNYNPEEIGAVNKNDTISIEELKKIFE